MNRDSLYLTHIHECIKKIEELVAEGKETFLDPQHYKTRDAILRNMQTMAESTQKLSAELKGMEPSIPWRAIAGFRNVLVHEYLGLDLELVWNTLIQEIPKLHRVIARYME